MSLDNWTFYPPDPRLETQTFRWNSIPVGPEGVIGRILLRTHHRPLGHLTIEQTLRGLATLGKKRK